MMEFLIEYRLLGLFYRCLYVFDYRPVPPRRRQGGVLLGNAMLVGFSVARLGRHGRFAADRQRASGRVGGGIRLFVVMDDQGTVRAARAGGQGLVSRQSEKEGKEIVNAGGATGMPVYGFPFLRRKEMAAPWQNGYSLFLLATNLISNPVVKVTPIKHQIHHLESENIRESILDFTVHFG